ncbi:coiled-coil domain-containing protein 25 [Penicillium lagena]|uniref:coiled-coil domain-containing protein 25 n=1 Tax=Penicillium lagena TaxID=94218 RepID=UPI002541CE69|nr:coiled-coil domain-containing protein 25 [Penicillium lagena]KAJ5602160.1 coiled-coil domain-containing protein 25 [Penicillium lagena]
MVYYFTSNVVSPAAFIYVGKDKFENEGLINFGLESDVWVCFHVDNLSSAHVYVRLRDGETWDNIPEPLLEDCAQLTKANSIEGQSSSTNMGTSEGLISGTGNKKDNITIIYTPWSNLKKDGSMATGQVSFHNPKLVKKVLVRVRENPIVNRLNKTRVEKFPDLRAEKEEWLKKKQHEERKIREEQKARDKQEKREREQLKWQKDHAYDDMFSEENMEASSNQDRDADFLDDFM